MYGGDGVSNFALPDFRGRVPISFGTGPGIAPKEIGQTGGTENNTLTVSQLPPHTHTVAAVTAEGNVSAPGNALPANTKLLDKEYSSSAGDTTMSASMIGSTGGGAQVNNMQPFLTVTFIIALTGNYPAP
ncbi:MAG: phage tail protein [Flavobacterium sp.]|nr:MAG: phage tail protein [Flavobacterium sp.]